MKNKPLNPSLLILLLMLFAGCSETTDAPEIPETLNATNVEDTGDKPDTLVTEGYDPVEMEAAITRARSEVDHFIEVVQTGNADSFLVKTWITEGEKTESFWMKDITYEEGLFKGLISNEPGTISNVTYGQEWSVPKNEITDWIYNRGEKMHGGYTIEPLLSTWDPAKAEEVRKRLVR